MAERIMQCREFEDRLADLCGGRLSRSLEADCLRHTEQCQHCMDLLHTVRGDRIVASPDGLGERILQATSGSGCGEARELMCDLTDGTLASGATHLLEQHLRFCSGCRALFEVLSDLRADLPALAASDPGAGFVERVLASTSRQPIRPPRRLESALDLLRSFLARPRFALEAAYIGTLLLFGLHGLLPGEPLNPALFSASPVPTELHRTVSNYAATARTAMAEQGAEAQRAAAGYLEAVERSWSTASHATAARVTAEYRESRDWLLETYEQTRSRVATIWHGPSDAPRSF